MKHSTFVQELILASAFGVLTIAQGFIQDWGSLAALRVLLGVFEGALLPSTLFREFSIVRSSQPLTIDIQFFKFGILDGSTTNGRRNSLYSSVVSITLA
jgi:hypothetical protein